MIKNGDNIKVKLNEILYIPEREENTNLDMSKIPRVGLHLKGISAIGAGNILSKSATKYYKRTKNNLIYGKQNIINGSIAIIPPEFDGFSTSAFVPSLRFKDKFNSHDYRMYIYYFYQENPFIIDLR